VPPFPPVIDTPLAVYENVLFADSYWQDISYPEGEEVAGAYNRLWTQMPGGYHDHANAAYRNVADHLNVHLAYHATVDLSTPASDGEGVVEAAERTAWFNDYETVGGVRGQRAGFVYSLIDGGGDRLSTDTPVTGGDQVVDGYHDDPLLGGGGPRSSLTWASAEWPNALVLEVLRGGLPLGSGTTTVELGEELAVRRVVRDFDSELFVTIDLDADRNPYNSNTLLTIETDTHGATGTSFVEETTLWDTSAVPAGSEGYVMARVSDGTRTRFLYAGPRLRIVDAEIFVDGFESGDTSAWTAAVP
jgi:hypothetical protein